MKVNLAKNTQTSVKNITKQMRQKGQRGIQIARRYTQTNNTNFVSSKLLEIKSFIKYAVTPFFSWASEKSKTVETLFKTTKQISKNITKSVNETKAKNPKTSKIIGTVKGIDESIPIIGSAALTVAGIKDIKEATKNEGTMAGVKETGKSVARVTTSAAIAAAGALLIPVPGMATAGWLTGESLANLAFGEPYSSKNAKQGTQTNKQTENESLDTITQENKNEATKQENSETSITEDINNTEHEN